MGAPRCASSRLPSEIAQRPVRIAVLPPVVLDGEPHGGVGQVEVVGPDRVLEHRWWPAGVVQREPDPGLHRRAGPPVGQRDGPQEQPGAGRPEVVVGVRHQLPRLEPADAAQGDDGHRQRGAATEVERRAPVVGDGQPGLVRDRVVGQPVVAQQQSRLRAAPGRDDDLGREPLRPAGGAEQLGCRPAGRQPARRDGGGLGEQCRVDRDIGAGVGVAEQAAEPRPAQLLRGDEPGGDGAGPAEGSGEHAVDRRIRLRCGSDPDG